MELLCALLTAFFFWLFLLHWHRSSLARAREAGGALLVEATAGRRQRRMARVVRILLAVQMLMPCAVFGFMFYLQALVLGPDARTPPVDIVMDIMVGFAVFFILQAILPSFRLDAAQELCEHGVVRSAPIAILIPWGKVTGCRWYDKRPRPFHFRRWLYLERGDRPAEEFDAINAVAARFVSVYDVKGQLIAEPDPAAKAAGIVSPRPGWRFQFNLQSLLLLAVVVSCAASCYGIHYRRARPQREAVAQFDKFGPQVHEMGDDVWCIEFTACTVKPGDDDLVAIERLPNLEFLYLEGSPITDAGLKHLYSLKKLRMVTLSNTNVTQKGVDDLKRALPNTHVSWYAPTPPVAVPPMGGKKKM